ncbi:hypothetical protein BpHYR1_026567 [Brachionus plicatilis]|uniref:Uncharacterized protein n=1 Tax=Brachionus plicatilis TaxID=10195 RepID=A0A3M7PE12_BRAPC|nr:hypothetical protein BpHYR1_026567 [Brachionus plicatilis]
MANSINELNKISFGPKIELHHQMFSQKVSVSYDIIRRLNGDKHKFTGIPKHQTNLKKVIEIVIEKNGDWSNH